MPAKPKDADLFDPAPLVFDLDGAVLPDDHSAFKLFPGKTYRLAKAMRESGYVFLDIKGLTSLTGLPSEWSDESLLSVISLDRIARDGETHGRRKGTRRGGEQDKKRLRFLKNLFFEAKLGDLVLVPLGEGFRGKIAIGELQDEPGDLTLQSYVIKEDVFETYGRKIKWLNEIYRDRLSPEVLKSIHSPTAFHILKRSWQEELYIHAYGTFVFQNVYVAKFPSTKEIFSTQDYGNIGALFNGISVAHDHAILDHASNGSLESEGDGLNFLELALFEQSGATIDLIRNSPLSVILRTIGPLAFSAAIVFSASAEGKSIDDLQHVQVTARAVGSATDRCQIVVPPDVASAAIGLGYGRYNTFCRVRAKVEEGASVTSPAHLKNHHRSAK